MDADTFDVVIVGFDDREEPPETRLQRAFGIDPATAAELIARLPATVQRAVSRVRADYFMRALAMIGARAELRDQHGERVAPAHAADAIGDAQFGAPNDAQARPSQGAIALAATDRPVAPWHADTEPIDPMSQTMTMAAAGGNALPGAAAPSPPFAPRRASVPAGPPGPQRAPLATLLEARTPEGPSAPVFAATGAAGAARERPATEPQFAAVRASAPPAAPAAWSPPASIPPVAAASNPTTAAGAWRWDATPVGAAAPPSAARRGASARPPVPPASAALGAAARAASNRPPAPPAPIASAPTGAAARAASNRPPAPHALPGAAAPVTAPWTAASPWAPSPGPAAEPSREPAWLASGPSGVFDPAPGTAAAAAPAPLPQVPAPRDPSSVFDPPPARAAARPRAGAAPAPLPNFGMAALEPVQDGAGLSLDTVPHERARAALTLDADPHGAALRMLSPWEQPSPASMVEPTAQPEPRAAQSQRPPRARARAADAAPRAALEPGAPASAPRARAQRPNARAGDNGAAAARPAAAVEARERASARPPERRATSRSLANADGRSFWESIGSAVALPFSGPGPYWIGAITAWSAAVSVLGFFANFAFPVGPFVMFFANTSVLAFACDYYRVCLWAPATSEDKLDRAPDFDPVRLLNSYMKSGMHLMLFLIMSQLPLIAWIATMIYEEGLEVLPELAVHPLSWLLMLLPYFYWPMGVGLTAVSNDFAAIWNVPAGLRIIARAPSEYTVIVGIGVLTFIAAGIALFVFGSALGITGSVIAGTLGFPLAVVHGVQGALMGHLVRSRGEIFEEQ